MTWLTLADYLAGALFISCLLAMLVGFLLLVTEVRDWAVMRRAKGGRCCCGLLPVDGPWSFTLHETVHSHDRCFPVEELL